MNSDLYLRQRSAWNGFVFAFADSAGATVGALGFATFNWAQSACCSGFEYGLSLPQASQPVQAFLLVAAYLVRR